MTDKPERIRCRALLFDMDGVLIDSTPAVERVWRRWAIERGFDPDEVVRRAHGRPSITTVREYLPQADDRAENRIIERREIEDLDGVAPLPGTLDLLRALPADRWAIVTSCTRPLAEVRARAAHLPRPACFVTSDDVRHGKPAADPYLKGSEMLGVAARDCVVLEDVPAGVQSGKAAGARVIGILSTVGSGELRAAGADWVVKNCAAISVVKPEAAGGTIELMLAENL
ncbi:MAG TPA: HAD family hydrolase [Candidatus Acidoferrales bacterium]|nr:HAD family hydrolase [Candidatus Acidoferrales bacterium]